MGLPQGIIPSCVSSLETSVRNPASISILAIGGSLCCIGGEGSCNWCSGKDALGIVGIVANLNPVCTSNMQISKLNVKRNLEAGGGDNILQLNFQPSEIIF